MGCRCAPACSKATRDATLRWPKRNRASDGCCGDVAHAKRRSDHNPDSSGYAHAFDLTHDPKSGVDCHTLAAQLVKAKDPRVKYIIWDRRIWYPTRGARPQGWSAYTGPNKHTHHMHVSIHAASRNDLRPWPWSPPVAKAAAKVSAEASEGESAAGEGAGGAEAVSHKPAVAPPAPRSLETAWVEAPMMEAEREAMRPTADEEAEVFTPETPGDEKAGEGAPDNPAKAGEPVVGGRPDDPSVIVTKSWKARLTAAVAGVPALLTAAKGFLSENAFLIAVGLVCVTLVVLALIFRAVIIEQLRLKLRADPTRYNVR